jgi:hypothetical protein
MEPFDKIDAKIDFFYGAVIGSIPFLFGVGWFFIITVPACAVLFAMGGDDDYRSVWRDVGCAVVNSVCLILATGNLLFLGAAVAVYGLLTVGLGLPSTQPPDAGSPVGRIAWKLANGVEWLANVYTHAFLFGSIWAVYFVTSLLRGIIW